MKALTTILLCMGGLLTITPPDCAGELRENGHESCFFGRATILSARSAKVWVANREASAYQVQIKDKEKLAALVKKLIAVVGPQLNKVPNNPSFKSVVFDLTITLYSDDSAGAPLNESDLAKAYSADNSDALLIRIPITTITTGKDAAGTEEIISGIIKLINGK